jgi:hypothetical protein
LIVCASHLKIKKINEEKKSEEIKKFSSQAEKFTELGFDKESTEESTEE